MSRKEQIENLQKELHTAQARRDVLGKEHQELSNSILEQSEQLGGKMLNGRDASKDITAITRDRVKAEGLLSAMHQVDAQIREYKIQTLDLARDDVRAEAKVILDEIQFIADELAPAMIAIHEKAARGNELHRQINDLIDKNSSLMWDDMADEARRWQAFTPARHCLRIWDALGRKLREMDVERARSGKPYLP